MYNKLLLVLILIKLICNHTLTYLTFQWTTLDISICLPMARNFTLRLLTFVRHSTI